MPEDTVFLNTDRPRPSNNVFIFVLVIFGRLNVGGCFQKFLKDTFNSLAFPKGKKP